MSAAPATVLPGDLDGGMRRLKLAAMRRLAPELLTVAKAQRWSPEEFLRTLIDAEITSRDESNARSRMKAAAFPVVKTITEFDVAASSIPRATFDYLASLEWIRASRELLRGRPGRHRQVPQPDRVRRRRRPGRAQGPLLHRRRPGRDALPGPGRQLRRPRHRQHPARRPGHRRPIRVPSHPSVTSASVA
jgi:hypothetical protein